MNDFNYPARLGAGEMEMDFAGNAQYEELISELLDLRENMDLKAWKLGDIAVKFVENFGKRNLKNFAKQGGVNVRTMRSYMRVSQAFPPDIRSEYNILSWTHFRIVANNPNAMVLLTRAADEGWSCEKLEMAAKPPTELPNGQFIDDGKPIPAMPEMKFCTVCRKWFIAYEEDRDKICTSNGIHSTVDATEE